MRPDGMNVRGYIADRNRLGVHESETTIPQARNAKSTVKCKAFHPPFTQQAQQVATRLGKVAQGTFGNRSATARFTLGAFSSQDPGRPFVAKEHNEFEERCKAPLWKRLIHWIDISLDNVLHKFIDSVRHS